MIITSRKIKLKANNSLNKLCHNFNLGLATKAKAWKGVGQKCNPIITFLQECDGMSPHIPK